MGFESRSVLVLGLGGQPDNYSRGKFPPWFGLGFSFGLVLVLGGGNFPRGQLSLTKPLAGQDDCYAARRFLRLSML